MNSSTPTAYHDQQFGIDTVPAKRSPSQFSAAGPTADGRFAPDLSAPGEFIVSALAATAPPSDPRSSFFFLQDPLFLIGDDGADFLR